MVTLHYPGKHRWENGNVLAWINLNHRRFSVSKVPEAYSDTTRETRKESDAAIEDRDLETSNDVSRLVHLVCLINIASSSSILGRDS